MSWILIIVLPGTLGIESVQFERMPEAQCRAALTTMEPLKRKIGLACVGPDGQIVEMGE
ncbi:hypothetical protein [Profundibacter sp.]